MTIDELTWAMVNPARHYDPSYVWARVKHKGGEIYAIALPVVLGGAFVQGLPEDTDYWLYMGAWGADFEKTISHFDLALILSECEPLRPFRTDDYMRPPKTIPVYFDDGT